MCEWMAERFSESSSSHFILCIIILVRFSACANHCFVTYVVQLIVCITCMSPYVCSSSFIVVTSQNRSTTSLSVVRTSLLHFSRRTRKTRPSNSFIYCMHACTSHTPSGVTITKISDKTKQNRRINPFLLTQSNVRLPEVERKLDVIVAIERRDG